MSIYVNEGKRNYIAYESLWEEDDFWVNMIKKNKIEGLLEFSERNFDGSRMLYYNITGKQSLQNIGKIRTIGYKEIQSLIMNLKLMYDRIDLFFLDPNHLDLAPANIFTDFEMQEWEFAYSPYVEKSEKKLIEFLTDAIDSEDEETVNIVYEMYDDSLGGIFYPEKYLGKLENNHTYENNVEKDVDDLWEEWKKEVPDNTIREAEENVMKKRPVSRVHTLLCIGSILVSLAISITVGIVFPRLISMCGAFLIIESGIFLFFHFKKRRIQVEREVSEHTQLNKELLNRTMLEETGSENERKCFGKESVEEENTLFENKKLLGVGYYRNYSISLERSQIVGSDLELCSVTIGDSSVCRMHAHFFERDGKMWVEDLNSKSGTYINGSRLRPNEIRALLPEDEIRLGRVEFIYR